MKIDTPKLLSNYKLIMKNSQDIIIFFNSSGRIMDCSSKAVAELGYKEDIYDIQISDIFKKVFIAEGEGIKIEDRYQNSLQETVAYRKNQTCFPVEMKIAVINKGKKYIGICNATNISAKKDAAREINSLKDDLNDHNQVSIELVARIAHELRTPINGILGFSNNLMDMDLKPEQREAVYFIKRCCSNMNISINDLLDFAKLSNNKLILEQRAFSFRHLIRQVVAVNIMAINEKGLNLSVNISNDIPDGMIGDEHRLSQILNNLFSNAVKFTMTGQINLEVVKISQTERNIELFFMVIDTGIGIGRDEKDKLFKSFSQVDSSITRRFGGTGLGLSICKRLVEAMNGTIEVDSEKNKGSTFSFSVWLGLPQVTDRTGKAYDKADSLMIGSSDNEVFSADASINSEVTDIDYINMMLKDINVKEVENSQELMQKAVSCMNDLIEKLEICIEMENWEKAEELANQMKSILPSDHSRNSKKIFRLLLSIRKENHDSSLLILNDFKISMLKEK